MKTESKPKLDLSDRVFVGIASGLAFTAVVGMVVSIGLIVNEVRKEFGALPVFAFMAGWALLAVVSTRLLFGGRKS